MFENQAPNNPEAPLNLPAEEPKDMFSGVEKEESVNPPNALKYGLLKKKEPTVQHNVSSPAPVGGLMHESDSALETGHKSIFKKVILAVLVAMILGSLGFGGWYLYSKRNAGAVVSDAASKNTAANNPSTPQAPVEPKPAETQVAATPTTSVGQNKTDNNVLFAGSDSGVDSDKDGLTDAEEQQLGTNPLKPDSDGDGLSDGDEVNIWRTDPLKKDTDGDGFPDGQEVKSGFNPIGPGKLLNPPVPKVRLVTSTVMGDTTSTKDQVVSWAYASYDLNGFVPTSTKN